MAADIQTCFVVMPYGRRKVGRRRVDFDAVYRELIAPAVADAGLEPLRSDEIEAAGWIPRHMIINLVRSRVALVDVTNLNANVFYELGVRHALCPGTTIIIRRAGTDLPFNIAGMQTITYPGSGSYARARDAIARAVRAGLESGSPDSPVTEVLGAAGPDPRLATIAEHRRYCYRLRDRPDRRVCLQTGDLENGYNDVDVWVNSENTDMQMARFYDHSISAMIRYQGAEKAADGMVVRDTMQALLTAASGPAGRVDAAQVVVTDPGRLRSRGVRKIFHVASVQGQPHVGYTAIKEVQHCVTNALECMQRPGLGELRSIIFPILGTGTGGATPEVVVPKLIAAAVDYLVRPQVPVIVVYFQARNLRILEACRRALDNDRRVLAEDALPAGD
jgi:O-acetyl-ADP-ribose deacetylase (regulator of RNase III)